MPEVSPLLALDISTHLGHAARAADGEITFGIYHLDPDPAPGCDRLASILDAGASVLRDLIMEHAPERVIAEEPLPAVNMLSQDATASMYGLHALLRVICYRRRLPLRYVRSDTARKTVLGRARFGGREEAKRAVMRWAREAGYRVTHDGQADALVVLHHALAHEPIPAMT